MSSPEPASTARFGAFVRTPLLPVRVAWLLLPVLAGPAVADAFGDSSRAVQVVSAALSWAGWGVGLVAALVPRPISSTALRILAPGAFALALWAAVGADRPGWAGLAVFASALALLAAVLPAAADAHVDAASYGDEERVALRVPASLLLGPVPLAWALVAAGVVAGPLLLAARQWVPGVLAAVVGLPLAFLAAQRLHELARRWLVFVPAGVVVHDPMTLTQPVLCQRHLVRSFGPAPADAADDPATVDLTGGALGLAFEIHLAEALSVGRRQGRDQEEVSTPRLLVTPGRPAATLAVAQRRRLPVGG